MNLNDLNDQEKTVILAALRCYQQLQVQITGIRNGGPSITNSAVNPNARIARRMEMLIQGDNPDSSLYNRDGSVKGF